MSKTLKRQPRIVFDQGKPASVILDIDQYQFLLEQIESAEDLKELHRLKEQPLHFRPFSDFLNEQS